MVRSLADRTLQPRYTPVSTPAPAENGATAKAEPQPVKSEVGQAKAVFHAASEDWRQFAEPEHVEIAKKKVDNWHGAELQSTVHDLFKEVDANGDGHLEWNNSEIRAFVKDVFQHLGLPQPQIPEMVWYRMYREVDTDGDYTLTEREATILVKHILTRILHWSE